MACLCQRMDKQGTCCESRFPHSNKIHVSTYIDMFIIRMSLQCLADIKMSNTAIDSCYNIDQSCIRWPKKSVVLEIVRNHGCTIIPIGYHNPRNPNGIKLIEWQIQFVRAEQLLLRNLGSQQVVTRNHS